MGKIDNVNKDDEILSIEDALILEEYEIMQRRHRRTRHAIHDTYGSSKNKKRHKLSGKRKWKNKDKEYAKLSGKMHKDEFNHRKKVTEILDRAYKKKHAKRQKHSLY